MTERTILLLVSNTIHTSRTKKKWAKMRILTLKLLGGECQFDLSCGFLKNVSSKERVKRCFFFTFNIIIRHIFTENLTEITQVVQKL